MEKEIKIIKGDISHPLLEKFKKKTKMSLHTELASGRWRQMSITEQLANIGSEYSRALKAHKSGNENQNERKYVQTEDTGFSS